MVLVVDTEVVLLFEKDIDEFFNGFKSLLVQPEIATNMMQMIIKRYFKAHFVLLIINYNPKSVRDILFFINKWFFKIKIFFINNVGF